VRQEFETKGYWLAPGLFSDAEVQAYIDHYMAMLAAGGGGYAEGGVHPDDPDPLKRFPRLLQPHRGDETSLRFMIDPRLDRILTELLGKSPLAAQTMLYFKPAGARGQALHQDQRYLRVENGTCVAAWLALDDCDEENGCLEVVPGTQDLPIICPSRCDMTLSFTTETVVLPEGYNAVPIPMKAGDVLFFNGSLVHGSKPNSSATRFRRSLIGHYTNAEATAVASFYHPLLRMDGSVVELAVNPYGGPCGVFEGGDVKMHGSIEEALAAH
jgi:hypothetical protein